MLAAQGVLACANSLGSLWPVPQLGAPWPVLAACWALLISASLLGVLCAFQCFIKVSAAYGSMKDISVYSALGLPSSQIFIVGRPAKKYQHQCQVLEGVRWGSQS